MRILKFSSERCAPCKMVSETLEKKNLDGIEIVELNSLEHLDEFKKYGIRTVPTLIQVDEDGEVIERLDTYSFLSSLENK